VPTAISLLSESLLADEEVGRGRLAYLVRALPLLCREARDLWRKERQKVRPLLTYCDYLFTSAHCHRRRYLDGVIPDDEEDERLWTEQGGFGLGPQDARRAIALPDVFKNRLTSAEQHDAARATREVGSEHPSIRFMDRIVQVHMEFRLHRAYARHFTECQRVGCTRPALRLAPKPEPEEEASCAAEYWKCCRDGRAPPPRSSLPSDMSFCCHGCYKATNAEFKRLVRFDIQTPLCASRHGPTTPSPAHLYRAAVKRNQAIARQVRSQQQVKTKHYPSTMANREQMVREQTMVLSVDLGLLFAASIIHQMPASRRPNRPLPCTEDWRDSASCFFGAVERVRDFYLAYGKGLLARDGTELWLRRLNDQVLDVF
jgi:hypothetical protein